MFQLILNPIRDWNPFGDGTNTVFVMFQLILNPIRDWNISFFNKAFFLSLFQLILNPIRDWNHLSRFRKRSDYSSN